MANGCLRSIGPPSSIHPAKAQLAATSENAITNEAKNQIWDLFADLLRIEPGSANRLKPIFSDRAIGALKGVTL